MRLLGEGTIHDHFTIINVYQFILSNLNTRLWLIPVLGILLFLFNNSAAVTVDTLDDLIDNQGDCSLREAIKSVTTTIDVDGCTYDDSNIINFDSLLAEQTIFFTSTSDDPFTRLIIDANLTIEGSNITLDGGNKRVLEIASGKTVNLIGLTITNKSSDATAINYGGNIHNSGILTLTNCMLKNGQANYRGGGIYNAPGASLTLYSSTVYKNQILQTTKGTPTGGGGIYNDGGTITIINSTITNNEVTTSGDYSDGDHGGGIRNLSGTLTIENSTITYNSVANTNTKHGGGIYVDDGTVTIKNSIIAGNNFGAANPEDCKGTIISKGYNLIGETTGCPTDGTGDIPFNGSITSIFDDPFPDLVGTVHQLKPSLDNNPALEAVPNGTNGCGAPPFDYDQLGTPRPYSPPSSPQNCDIGAYEMAPIIYHKIGVNPAAKEENLAKTKTFVINRYGGAISCDTTINYTVTGTATLGTGSPADYQITNLSANGIPSSISGGNFSFSLRNLDYGKLLTKIFSDTDPETDEDIIVTLFKPQLKSSTECQNILNFFGETAPQFLLDDGTPFTEISATFTITDDDDINNSAPSINSITITDPDPHTSLDVVNAITIEFSEIVSNFDFDELTLTRDSNTISFTDQTLITIDGGKTWVLDNLTGLTETNGNYQLTVVPGDIVDSDNNPLTDGANLTWQKISPPPTFLLNITKSGSGNGTITGNGINCGTICNKSYSSGTNINLNVVADSNSIFAGWSPNCSSPFTINSDMNCTATFELKPSDTVVLTILKTGTGEGNVSINGLACGNPCNQIYAIGNAITLTAMPNVNSSFAGWSGTNCSSSFTITTSTNCTAKFERKIPSTSPTPLLPQTMTVTLSQPGNGQGKFVFDPNPQETTCNLETAQCSYKFLTATWVTVTAKADSNSTFKGWSGSSQCYQNEDNQLTFFMNDNYNCTAEFERLPTVLKLVTIGNGQILISPTGHAIPCEMEQCFQFDFNREVTLTPQADKGFYFDRWSNGSDCQTGQVQMDNDKVCAATFGPFINLILDYDPRQGQVTLTPAGENCGEYCQSYQNNTPVTLTAQPQPGYQLASWGSDCNQRTLTTTLEISLIKDLRCEVTFTPITTTSPANSSPATFSTLTVNVSGNGSVTSVPPGISCDSDCTESYPTGTGVTLTATPAPNFQVVSWSESCLSGQVFLETNKTCQVTFEATEATQPEKMSSLSTIQFAIPEYQVSEDGQGKALVLVTRSGSELGTIDVDFTTIDGTALADSDYIPINSKLTWSNGDTTPKTITVPILRDDLNEATEIFIVRLSNLTGEAQFGPYSQAVVTIVDNANAGNLELVPTQSTDSNSVLPSPTVPSAIPTGRIQFAAPIYEVLEQDALAPLEGLIKIPVARVDGNQGKVAVNYMTQDGTAIAGEHYQQSEGKIVWDDGETGEKLIEVDIWDNKLREETKSFRLILFNPTNGAILGEYPDITVLIKDDDGSVVGFSPDNTYLAFEGNQQAKITVSRSNSSLGEVSLRYTTIDGTAKAGKDYEATSGTLNWGNREHQDQVIHIPLLSSLDKASNKTFQLSLFDSTGEVALATPSTVSVTITTGKPNLCEIINNVVDCLIIREKDSPILENIHITSRGILVNSRLAGQIQNAGWLQNTLLMPNTTVTGGYVNGVLSGQPEHPVTAFLRHVEVVAGASLNYVVIGKGSHVANQTNLDEGVCFETNDLIPNQTLNKILGYTEAAVLGQKAVKLSQDVLCQSAIGGILGAINELPQLKNLGWQVTQDPITGVLDLAREDLHFAALPLQVNQVLTEEMVDELPLGITLPTSGEVIFYTHTGRKIIAYPIIQAPLTFQDRLRQLGLNTANLLANGNIEVPLADGSYFVAHADLVAKRVSLAVPVGLNYTTQPISLVFADQQDNHWQQMLYPTAAYPEALDKLADSPATTQLTPTGRVKVPYNGNLYEGTFDYLVTPNQQPRANNDLQLINTEDLNGDGCKDSWIYYHTGEKQALLSNCFKGF